jgi:hypothetical protein
VVLRASSENWLQASIVNSRIKGVLALIERKQNRRTQKLTHRLQTRKKTRFKQPAFWMTLSRLDWRVSTDNYVSIWTAVTATIHERYRTEIQKVDFSLKNSRFCTSQFDSWLSAEKHNSLHCIFTTVFRNKIHARKLGFPHTKCHLSSQFGFPLAIVMICPLSPFKSFSPILTVDDRLNSP